MAENTAFSSSGEDVITRTLNVSLDNTTQNLSPAEFDVYYDIEDTASWIRDGGYTKVRRIRDSLYRLIEQKIGCPTIPR